MQLDQFVSRASDAITVRRVFAEPYEKNGTTVIAAARVQGGGGGGEDTMATPRRGRAAASAWRRVPPVPT